MERYPSENIIRFLMDENSTGNVSIMYQGGPETEHIFNELMQYVIDSRNSISISKLNGFEVELEKDINNFKASVENTLYVHLLPSNSQCPFLPRNSVS